MKRAFICALSMAIVMLGAPRATAQQAPHMAELIWRFEQFNKLYNARLRSGFNSALIDPLRKRAEEAFRSFNTAALVEVLAEATIVLEGKAWGERERFIGSLALETDSLVIEPNQDFHVSLVRMYATAPQKVFQSPITVTIEVHPYQHNTPISDDPPAKSPLPEPIGMVEKLAIAETSTVSSRRLLLSDGIYFAVARVEADGGTIAELSKPFYAIGDFRERIRHLTGVLAEIKTAADPRVKALLPLTATSEFQLKRLSTLTRTRGAVEINPFSELDRIDSALTALGKGQNPFARERGEIERAYRASDGELVPYRAYVPLGYDGSQPRPLVVALHGILGDERSYFSNQYDPVLVIGEAERRTYILAAPSGRSTRSGDLGQEDVLEVIKLVTRDYAVDPARIYLTGHSMGGSGTWAIASARPDLFAAIAPVAGGGPAQIEARAALVEKLKQVPVLAAHGARDSIVPPDRSRQMVAAAQKAGVKVEYIEVPDADHISIVAATFPAIMDFFEKHPKPNRVQ